MDGIISKFDIIDKKTEIGIEVKQSELILCKHCKHYVVDRVLCDIEGMPVMVADSVSACKRWGNRFYMTDPDGYCYLAEKGE